MSEWANVELVRSLFAAWERGDYSSSEWADPAIEYVWPDGPSPGTWKGLAQMAEGFRDYRSAWEDYRIVVDEYREIDGERVLVLFHRHGRGKTSGPEIGLLMTQGAALLHVREDKVTRLVGHSDRDRALADLDDVELAPEGDATWQPAHAAVDSCS